MAEDTKAADSATEDESAVLPGLVDKTIQRHALYAAAGGLIPLPLIEVAASSTIQLRMIAQLCDHYNLPFSEQSVKAAIGALVGSVLPVSAVGYAAFSLFRSVPLVGPALGTATLPIVAGATTWALGRVFAWHFAKGGTLSDFDAGAKKEQFKREFQEGKRRASEFIKGSGKAADKGGAAEPAKA